MNTQEEISIVEKNDLTEDYLFKDNDFNTSVETDVENLNLPPTTTNTENSTPLDEEFVGLNSNKDSFEKSMRQNLFDLLRCLLLLFTIYYRTNILVPNSFYRAETRHFLNDYFIDHFDLDSNLSFSLDYLMNKIKDINLIEDYYIWGNQSIKIKFNSDDTKIFCDEFAFEYDEFPFNQICVKTDLTNTIDLTNASNYTSETNFETNITNETSSSVHKCPRYVYGAESNINKEDNNHLDYFSSFWNYINKFSCVDYVEKIEYETNCDGFLIDNLEFK